MTSVSLGMAFLGGLLSFLSPCILPVAPGYLGLISGVSLAELKSGEASGRRIITATLAFIAGFTIIFTVLGLTSSYIGQAVREYRGLLSKIGGIAVIVLGLHLTGLLSFQWLYRERRIQSKRRIGVGGAFVTGLAFAVGWTPCVGPILGGILAVAADQANTASGLILLLVYSLGLGIPFFLLALAFEKVSGGLNKVKPYLKYLEWAAGGLLIIMGVLLLTNNLTLISSWIMRMTGGWSPENLLGK